MGKARAPVTPAVRALRAAGVAFTDHLYDCEEKGGTAVPARELGVDEHCVVKTLVMEDDRQQPLIVLNAESAATWSGSRPRTWIGCSSRDWCALAYRADGERGTGHRVREGRCGASKRRS